MQATLGVTAISPGDVRHKTDANREITGATVLTIHATGRALSLIRLPSSTGGSLALSDLTRRLANS